MGEDKIELLKESKTIDPSTLDQAKVVRVQYVESITHFCVCVCVRVQGHIQVTFVEPYFEDWELKERQSVFERTFNISEYKASALCVI